MDWRMLLENYGALLFLIVFTVIGLTVYHIRSNRPFCTGPATVVSRRMELARFSAGSKDAKTNNWNHLVTFRLNGGEEIELYTSGEEYQSLEEGLSGQLTWNGENFVNFDIL